jgi:hypothetical protein
MSLKTYVIAFDHPDVPGNTWHGSMTFDPVEGCQAEVVTEYNDPRLHPRHPLPVYRYRQLEVVGNLVDRILLVDMDWEGSGISVRNQRSVLTERFSAKVMVELNDPALTTLDSPVKKFTVASPAVFSFIDHHAYQVAITKRSKSFSVKDRPYKASVVSSQFFSSIKFDVGRSISNGSNGNIGKIEYHGSVTFTPRRPMSILKVTRVSQVVEKLLFLLVADRCGPLEVTIPGGKNKPARAEIKFASELYRNDDVVTGIWRGWTQSKVEFDFGAALDRLLVNFSQLEVPLELLIDAGSQGRTEHKFFRLVRAMEAITRDLMPKGSEALPEEISDMEKLIDPSDKKLKSFFDGRIKSIFNRPNSLGYGIELAKKTFPYPGIASLEKRDVVKLRGIEAHARAHSFTGAQLDDMHRLAAQLEFLCYACLLLNLGLTREAIAQGLDGGRFAWVLETDEDTPPDSLIEAAG